MLSQEMEDLFSQQNILSNKMSKYYSEWLERNLIELYNMSYQSIPDNEDAILSIPNEFTGGRTEYRINGEVSRLLNFMKYEYFIPLNPS